MSIGKEEQGGEDNLFLGHCCMSATMVLPACGSMLFLRKKK